MSPRRPNPPPTSPPKNPPPNPAGDRLQKVLAAAGLGSRREIEGWIEAGRVRLGERVAKLGDRAEPGVPILVDGKPVAARPKSAQSRVLAYHKPVGEMVTRSDPEGRPTVFAKLPPLAGGRWINVGRLDLNSSGLLLFTDDGALAHRLMHPSAQIEREYEVRVQGGLGTEAMNKLLSGVMLEDGLAKFLQLNAIEKKVQTGSNRWYRAVLAEGRNREVRRMVEAVGARVSRLVRVRFGPVRMPASLAPGAWAELAPEIVRDLKSC